MTFQPGHGIHEQQRPFFRPYVETFPVGVSARHTGAGLKLNRIFLQFISCIQVLQLSGCILILQLLGCIVLNTAYNVYKTKDTRA